MAGEDRLLLVCTANVCRSVYAASTIAHHLGVQIAVESAGVEARQGNAMCELGSELIAARHLVWPAQHDTGAQPLTPAAVERATLVLTFTTNQRARVARLAPTGRQRLFTLREAVALADSAGHREPDEALFSWVGRLNAKRPTLASGPGPDARRGWWPASRRSRPGLEHWDLADAHAAPPAIHRERLEEVGHFAQRLAAALGDAP